MEIGKQIGLIFRTLGFLGIEIPLKSVIRLLSVLLFIAEMGLVFVPCLLTEAVFMTKRTPFHWLADSIGELSEKLDGISDLENGFRIF